jgi:hypothetical protein
MGGRKRLPSDSKSYEVGYGKPPLHTRFSKGQSGNPGGRPRGMTSGRANELALREAYRLVTVREGDKVVKLPAIQAVIRSLVALAARGNGTAQRALIEMIQTIERTPSIQAAKVEVSDRTTAMSSLDVARRIAFILSSAGSQYAGQGGSNRAEWGL